MKELWKGIHKVNEELGEILQTTGKIGAFPEGPHPDGKGDLKTRLEDEFADASAAMNYMADKNGLDKEKIEARMQEKLIKFHRWGLNGLWVEEPK